MAALKQSPEEVSKDLCEAYVDGSLRFDLQQVEKKGLQKTIQKVLYTHARCRVSQFRRYKDYLVHQRKRVASIQRKYNGGGIKWEFENMGVTKNRIFKFVSELIPPATVTGMLTADATSFRSSKGKAPLICISIGVCTQTEAAPISSTSFAR